MTQIKLETFFTYIYGVILTEEYHNIELPSFTGIDHHQIAAKTVNELTAIVTPVNTQTFNQENIDYQIKDPEWLKEHAFHHHEVISTLQQTFTILPMSFCTIFQSDDNLELLLTEQYSVLLQKLLTLQGKQEWNIKMYCNKDEALKFITLYNPAVIKLQEELMGMPKGKQFLMKKRLDQLVTSELEAEQSKWWRAISEELSPIVSDSNLRANWGREVTERKDDMIVNCDFLLDQNKTDPFLDKLRDIEKSVEKLGCSIQVTGPWPPYHFSKMNKEHP